MKTFMRSILSGSFAGLLGSVALGIFLLNSAPAAAAPTWLPPNILYSVQNSDALRPEVAVDAAGDAVAIWSTDKRIVEISSRPAGGAFSPPEPISEPGGQVFEPHIALNSRGDAVAIWGRTDSGQSNSIEVAFRPAGQERFSPPEPISPDGKISLQPRVAINSAGDAEAVWLRAEGLDSVIETAFAPSGQPFLKSVVVFSKAQSRGFEPQIALNDSGEALAGWKRTDLPPVPTTTTSSIEVASSQDGKTFSEPKKLSGDKDAAGPLVSLDAAGDAVVVWSSRPDPILVPIVLETASAPKGGDFSDPDEISPPAEITTYQLAGNDAGDAAVVWSRVRPRPDNNNFTVESASRAGGGMFSDPVAISKTEEFVGSDQPQIVLGRDGSATAAWVGGSLDTGFLLVKTATRSPEGMFSDPVAASEEDADSPRASNPRIAVDSAGDAVAVWNSFNPDGGMRVHAATYDASGPELRSPSIPTTAIVGRAIPFEVTPFDAFSGPVTVLWDFGDGTPAERGSAVTHTYAVPGRHQLTLTATDGVGNVTSRNESVTVFPPPVTNPPPPPVTNPPPPPVTNPPPGPTGPRHAVATAAPVARLRGSTALLRMSCPTTGTCEGTARLAAGKQRRTLGRRAFQIAAGSHLVLVIRLTRRTLTQVRAAGRKGLPVRVEGNGVTAAIIRLRG